MDPKNINVRVFLAAYMITYRPTYVFEDVANPLAQALLESSAKVLNAFHAIVRCIESGRTRSFQDVPHDLSVDFETLLYEYLKAFKAWKVPDEAKLTCRIKHALIALYQAKEHLPPDEPEDSKLNIEFRTQIERLRSKLAQIAGEAALQEFDERRLAGYIPASDANGSGGNGGGNGGAGAAYAALPGRMTNEQLAHELLLDPTFQLDESGGCSVENPVFKRIRESFHHAFWDSLVDDLRLAAPCYVRVLRVLAEVRDGVNDLAGARESAALSDAIDLDFIKCQAEAGAYNWHNCCALIGSIVTIVQRVQAPKRDEETKTKWELIRGAMVAAVDVEQPRAFCNALEFLLDRLNAMRIDAANARLRLIAPVIMDHGIDYERGKFQDKLKDGSLTVERTTKWIDNALKAAVATKYFVPDDLFEGKASAFIAVHSYAMHSLINAPEPVHSSTCPETLLFDVYRLRCLHSDLRDLSLRATMKVCFSIYTTTS